MADYKKILARACIALSLIYSASALGQERELKERVSVSNSELIEKGMPSKKIALEGLILEDEMNLKGDKRQWLRKDRVPVHEMAKQRVEEQYGARALRGFAELKGQGSISDEMSRKAKSSFYPVIVDRVNKVVERGYLLPVSSEVQDGTHSKMGGSYGEFEEPIHVFIGEQ